MRRSPALQDERIERFEDFGRSHPRGNAHAQSLTRVLIKDGEHLVGPTIAQPVVDEVNRPDVVGVMRSEANDRSIVVVEPFALLVPMRQLQPLFAPQTLYLLVVCAPACRAQKLRDLAVSIAAILLGQSDESEPECIVGRGL